MSNLLPQEEKKIVRREYKLRVAGVFLLLTFVVECFGVVFLIPAYLYSDSKKSAAEGEKKMEVPLKDEDEKVFGVLAKLSKRITASKLQDHTPFSKAIGAILGHKEVGLRILSISLNEKSPTSYGLSVSGRADSRQALLTFKNSMEADPVIKHVAIPVSSFAQERNINFTATIEVDYKKSP